MAEMDVQQVLKLLPQRYPFLMIDTVRECRAYEPVDASMYAMPRSLPARDSTW